MQRLELLDLLLKYPDMIHECDDLLSSHGRSMQLGSCQEGSHVQRHVALGGVQDEQFGPNEAQKGNLVCDLKITSRIDFVHFSVVFKWVFGVKRPIENKDLLHDNYLGDRLL